MNIKIAIVVAGMLLVTTIGGYVYYKDSQRTIATLIESNRTLTTKTQMQEKAISTLQQQYTQQTKALNNLNSANASLNLEKEQLSNKLMKHDLEELSRRKPALVETRINNGTKELFRSFTDLSTN